MVGICEEEEAVEHEAVVIKQEKEVEEVERGTDEVLLHTTVVHIGGGEAVTELPHKSGCRGLDVGIV